MSDHLQADSFARSGPRMQTYSVFRSRILPADELWPRFLEMPSVQVSSSRSLSWQLYSVPSIVVDVSREIEINGPHSFHWLLFLELFSRMFLVKLRCWRDSRSTSICGAFSTRSARTAAAHPTPKRSPSTRLPTGGPSITNWWAPASRRRKMVVRRLRVTAPREPKWCHLAAWPYPPCPTGIWASPCPPSVHLIWIVMKILCLDLQQLERNKAPLFT